VTSIGLRHRRVYDKNKRLLQWRFIGPAVADSFAKLSPAHMWRNPVMFVTEIGALIGTIDLVRILTHHLGHARFVAQIALWLWLTVIFANFAEAMAERRGKAQADVLRNARAKTRARKVVDGEPPREVPGSSLGKGDVFVVGAGEVIAVDGEIVEGAAVINESAVTGEAAPVVRSGGGDHSGVTGGTTVLSDEIKVRVTAERGQSFLDRMIHLVEGVKRQKTPNELALSILLSALTLIFTFVVFTMKYFGLFLAVDFPISVLVALLVCIAPTTIGGLLSAIGIAGIDRMVQMNVLAMSGRAVEAAGDIDVLLLDKTGTITEGDRKACEYFPAEGVDRSALLSAAQLASLADETPEGRSILTLAEREGVRPRSRADLRDGRFVAFTAQTRMSGVDYDGARIRKGALDAIRTFVTEQGGKWSEQVELGVRKISSAGGTPLAVADGGRVLGVIGLADVIKNGLPDRLKQFHGMGIRTVMITGDNPLTANTIAKKAGVDSVVAQAKPEQKLEILQHEQVGGHLVAMTGDGVNDAPALAQADVGLAMNTGTEAAKEAGNMVDLDSDPAKLVDVVEVGKQMLITRGALTTFSIANDVAKYFAILPAMLLASFPQVAPLNVMSLSTPESATLSAVIFNAIIIVLLIPLALRGVTFRPGPASALLRHNLLVFGVGGLIAPFIGIKLVDVLLSSFHMV